MGVGKSWSKKVDDPDPPMACCYLCKLLNAGKRGSDEHVLKFVKLYGIAGMADNNPVMGWSEVYEKYRRFDELILPVLAFPGTFFLDFLNVLRNFIVYYCSCTEHISLIVVPLAF